MALSQEKLHAPLHSALARNGPNFDEMSDEAIVQFYLNQAETDQFHVPPHIVPDGVSYCWFRMEVVGQPDHARIAAIEHAGWQPVPQKRHPGLFMPPNVDGPIQKDGLALYELPTRLYRLKREAEARKGQQAVQSMNAQMSYAPPGTGPRGTHAYTQPVARSQPGSMEITVE